MESYNFNQEINSAHWSVKLDEISGRIQML